MATNKQKNTKTGFMKSLKEILERLPFITSKNRISGKMPSKDFINEKAEQIAFICVFNHVDPQIMLQLVRAQIFEDILSYGKHSPEYIQKVRIAWNEVEKEVKRRNKVHKEIISKKSV